MNFFIEKSFSRVIRNLAVTLVGALFIVAIILCLVGVSACAKGGGETSGGEEKHEIEYVYDGLSGGYIAAKLLGDADGRVEIPLRYNGESVVGVSCGILADEAVTEYVFSGEVFFTDLEKASIDIIRCKKLFADRAAIDDIRARLYNCADDGAIRENAIALANGIVPYNLGENEIYITFDYDRQSLTASNGNALPVFICEKGESFNGAEYAQKHGYTVLGGASEMDSAYSRGNGYILSDMTAESASVLGGFTAAESISVDLVFEKVFRVYIQGGGEYDLNAEQPDFCFERLDGRELPFRYVTESRADGLLGGIDLRRGFKLNWEYSVRGGNAAVSVKKLQSLSYALAEEQCDLDLFPVWTANEFELIATSSAANNRITYGEEVFFYARSDFEAEGCHLVYEWIHNGRTVGFGSTLNLALPSLDGASDGIYTLKATAYEGKLAFGVAYAEIPLYIDKRELTVVWKDGELVYNGGMQTPQAEVIGLDGEAVACTVEGGGSNVGEYTAAVKTSCPNYSLINAEKIFTISKAPLTVKTRDVCFIYGEQQQGNGVDFRGFADGDGEEVVKGTPEYVFTLPSLQVGKYANGVSVSGLAADNYFLITESGDVTISARTVTLNWSGADNLVYSGEEKRVTATVCNVSDGDEVFAEVIGGTAVNAGNYTATATLSGGDRSNYVLNDNTLNYTVVKADISLSVALENTQYGGALSPVVSGNEGGGEVTFVYGVSPDQEISTKRMTVGDYFVKASVAETANYNAAVAVSSFSVLPREVTLNWKNNTGLVYDSTTKNVSATAGNVLLFDKVRVKVNGGDKTNAGNYVAAAELEGDDAFNYALPQMHTCAYVIEKSPVTIRADGKTSVYGEELAELTAAVYGRIYNDEVNFTLKKQEGSDAGEYAIEVLVVENPDYEITTVPSRYIITRATPQIEGEADGNIFLPGYVAYGSTLSSITGELPRSSVDGVWKWAESGYVTVGDVGEKSFKAKFVPSDETNYNNVFVEVHMHVKRKNNFTVALGCANADIHTDKSLPYVIEYYGGEVYIDYLISGSWGDTIQGNLTVNITRKYGAAANVKVGEFTIVLAEQGEYLFTFFCSGNEEYMSGTVTITVIIG